MIIVHACQIIPYACTMITVHARTMTIVHAGTKIPVDVQMGDPHFVQHMITAMNARRAHELGATARDAGRNQFGQSRTLAPHGSSELV